MMRTILILVAYMTLLPGQTKRDPRVVGMAGAYTTIANGIFCVGYNPALITRAHDKPFMMQLYQSDRGILGNFLSIENVAQYSGDTLNTKEKDELFDNFEDGNGLSFFQDRHLPIPFINYSKGNLAYTSNMVFLSNFKIPIGLLELIFYGNGGKPDLDMTMNLEILGLNEFGFTFGIPFRTLSIGVTLKYLQGMFYIGIDPDSSQANLVTADEGLYGSGKYFIRQGIGGKGLGLDLGIVTKEINDWTFGMSMINILGTIEWNKPSGMKEFLKEYPDLFSGFYPFTWGDSTVADDEAILYTYTIDTLRMDNLGQDSLFTNNTVFIKDTIAGGKPRIFETRYPALFRFGISKRAPTYLIASDLVAGFQDKYYARAKWRWSVGVEWTKMESLPLRMGYSWAGGDLKELAMGMGFHKGPIIFDVGFAFRNGTWLHTMKGFNFSTGLTITSFGGWKSETEKAESTKGLRGLFNRFKKTKKKKKTTEEGGAAEPISEPVTEE
ncbi:MAG TPA: hypothetical protein EYO07_03440 [Candidatus Marinimicrobia bacterium]|nr:hypothetical protein [Candidatus Neomarinimicrobiota bacterium]